jgi:hypothetical protein
MTENIFKYYGLYGYNKNYGLYGSTKNEEYKKRKSQAKNDAYYYERETQYIHELYPEVLEHLKNNYNDINDNPYSKIKTFQFVPYKIENQLMDDIINVKKLINNSYLHELLNSEDRIPFEGLHIMREMHFRGYNKELSEEIIKSYLDGVNDVLNKLKNIKYTNDKNKEIVRLNRIYELEKGINRTCNNVHKIEGLEKDTNNNKLKIKILKKILDNIFLLKNNMNKDILFKIYNDLLLIEYLLNNELKELEKLEKQIENSNNIEQESIRYKILLILSKKRLLLNIFNNILLLENTLSDEIYNNIYINIEELTKLFNNNESNEKLLLEDLLNNNDEKQLLLGSSNITKKYVGNNKILISPWYLRELNMGIYSWNLSINKAMINCFLSNNLNQLFPIRLIFEFHPNHLSFDSITMIDKYKDNLKYLGFFIIRYDNKNYKNDNIINELKNNECKTLYYNKGDKLPSFLKINRQFLVLFVFKDENPKLDKILKYKIINFRTNFVEWGNFAEWKRIFLSEIIQVMCHNLNIDKINNNQGSNLELEKKNEINNIYNIYNSKINKIYNVDNEENKKIYFYSLLIKDNKEKKELNEICNNQKDELNNRSDPNKKQIMKCFEAYFFSDTFQKIKDLGCQPKSDDESLHVFVSNKTTKQIFDILKLNLDYQVILDDDIINIKNKRDNIEYVLLFCHFKWDDKITKRFGINHGELLFDDETRKFYTNTLCISNKCILDRDLPKFNIFNYFFHYSENDEQNIFNLPNDKFKREKLFNLIKKNSKITFDEENIINILNQKLFELEQNKLKIDKITKKINTLKDYYNQLKIKNNLDKEENEIIILLESKIKKNNKKELELLRERAKIINIIKDFENKLKEIKMKNEFEKIQKRKIQNINYNLQGGMQINIKKFKKYTKEFDILNHNFVSIINNFINEKEDINKYIDKLLFYSDSNNVYQKKLKKNNNYKKIIPNIPSFINTLYYLVIPNILIISRNLNYIDIILALYKNIKIILILFDYKNINNEINKLKKFKNVKIYIINEDNNNINLNFFNKINKIIKNKIYNSIIIDSGNAINNYYQEKLICIGILLCNNNLVKNGTFINYCMMPNNNNYYFNLLFILQSNFKLNYIITVGNYNNLHIKNRYIVYVHTNYKNNKKYDKIVKNFLIKEEIKDIDVTNEFIELLCIKWKELIYNYKQLIQNIFKINYNKNIK